MSCRVASLAVGKFRQTTHSTHNVVSRFPFKEQQQQQQETRQTKKKRNKRNTFLSYSTRLPDKIYTRLRQYVKLWIIDKKESAKNEKCCAICTPSSSRSSTAAIDRSPATTSWKRRRRRRRRERNKTWLNTFRVDLMAVEWRGWRVK